VIHAQLSVYIAGKGFSVVVFTYREGQAKGATFLPLRHFASHYSALKLTRAKLLKQNKFDMRVYRLPLRHPTEDDSKLHYTNFPFSDALGEIFLLASLVQKCTPTFIYAQSQEDIKRTF
jgi:hypothetical protein